MPKVLKSKKAKDEVVDVPVEDVVDAQDTQDVDVEATVDKVQPQYIDPFDFVYSVQAGKTYTGFNAQEAIQFAHTMIGKVDKVVISKMK